VGPGGMMLGLMLARVGVSVVMLQKPDFLRDFRRDTIHPSILEACMTSGCWMIC